jgi:hypothetical protein
MKFGARIFPLPRGKAIVKQTIKSASGYNSNYVLDTDKENNSRPKECHVELRNDKQIADAIRAALNGKLTSRGMKSAK